MFWLAFQPSSGSHYYYKNTNIQIWLTVTITSFIHSVFCLTTGPKPPLKRFLHIVRSRASSFKWEYPILSLRSSSSFLCLLPRLLVTSISPFIFPSITCFRRQILHKMWPIQLALHFLISCRIFLCSLTLSKHFFISNMIGPTDLLHPSPAPHLKTFQVFLICCLKFGRFGQQGSPTHIFILLVLNLTPHPP